MSRESHVKMEGCSHGSRSLRLPKPGQEAGTNLVPLEGAWPAGTFPWTHFWPLELRQY